MRLLRTINKSVLKGNTVLLRIDLNVEPGGRLDSYRLESVLPTIKLLRAHGARVVLMSHRGHPRFHAAEIRNPKSEVRKEIHELSLKPFAAVLSKKLGEKTEFVADADLSEAKRKIALSKGGVFLLENLRFWKGEIENNARFARQLAALGDLYANDAFPESHRSVASIVMVPRFLPSYAGPVLEQEIEHLGSVMKNPSHPVTLVIGGAKIADKIGVIEYFWKEADVVLLGGGPANTFFAADGVPMGDSLVDVSALPFVRKYKNKGKIILPVDSWALTTRGSLRILDIGGVSARWFAEIVKGSKTVVWNGPMGLFEKKGFEKGTVAMWKAVLSLAKKNPRARIVVGGGETVASLALIANGKSQVARRENMFLSTGGGAMLEFLGGKKLPGITALEGEPRQDEGR